LKNIKINPENFFSTFTKDSYYIFRQKWRD